MPNMIVFGWRTAILSVAVGQMVIVAGALVRVSANRPANRCLAALLLAMAGLLMPDAIGFAGFYDAFPWLSFAPFANPLAIGPLLYFYSYALAHARLPKHPLWHLAAPLLQFVYQAASFCLPLAAKNRWDDVSTPLVEPLITIGVIVGLAIYCVLILTLLHRHRARIADIRSDDERYAARWLSRTAVVMLILLAATALYDGYDLLVRRLDYFGALGLYLIIAAIGCFLAVEGWRYADRRFATPDPSPPAAEAPPERDWSATMALWSERVRQGRWYEDPALSLAVLARLLGTNSTYLSKAINEGLGVNFSTFIAQLRCDAVAAAIRSGSEADLLTLALDAGFGSKASFNRAFQANFGESPSTYRRQHGSDQQKLTAPGN